LCDHVYAGTREGLILVQKSPPKSTGSNGASRRAELADFLRTRRAALQPEDVGLAGGGRRRTPGLRREEVAQLAGVGTTWYTWLEQGRDVRASLPVLEGLASALELTPAERAHLITLGRGQQAAPGKAPREALSPTLERLIHNLGDAPACILGRRWDYLAWNRAYSVVLGDPVELPAGRRNMIWATFTDPERRKLFADWERAARNAVARFRADSARHVGDPEFEQLIAELRAASPQFREWWQRHEVARSGVGRKIVRHPKAGKLFFEHAVFRLEEATDQRLILYSPLPKENTPEKLAGLLAQDGSG
jgi:transcriptional regulator with XRE-family HTH domain